MIPPSNIIFVGILPLFLSPVQVNILPVNNEYHREYAKELWDKLLDNNIRCELDDREEKLSYRMRDSQTKKIPYTVVIGDKEKENNQVTYRMFGSTESTTVSVDDFIKQIKNEIASKCISKNR